MRQPCRFPTPSPFIDPGTGPVPGVPSHWHTPVCFFSIFICPPGGLSAASPRQQSSTFPVSYRFILVGTVSQPRSVGTPAVPPYHGPTPSNCPPSGRGQECLKHVAQFKGSHGPPWTRCLVVHWVWLSLSAAGTPERYAVGICHQTQGSPEDFGAGPCRG